MEMKTETYHCENEKFSLVRMKTVTETYLQRKQDKNLKFGDDDEL